MSKLKRILMPILFVFVFTFTADQASAQCRTCTAPPPVGVACYKCVDITIGFETCRILHCHFCDVAGDCPIEGVANRSSSKLLLSFDPNTIRQIAKKHPRFAATLANMNHLGGLSDNARLHWLPVPISKADVEWYLKPENESAKFFEKLERKIQHLSLKKSQEVIYEIAIDESADSTLATVHLKVIKWGAADPDYSSLKIVFLNMGNPEKKDWKVVRWQMGETRKADGIDAYTSKD